MAQALTASEEAWRHQFAEEGYIVVPGLLQGRQVQRVIEEYAAIRQRLVSEGEVAQEAETPPESLYPRLRDYHLDHPALIEMVLLPRLLALLEALLGEEALAVSTSYYFKAPGTRGLPMHQDNFSVAVAPGTTCSVWISLSDSDKENGGLYLVPRSHRLGLLQPSAGPESDSAFGDELTVPEGYTAIDLALASGDAVIFSGDLLHGSYPNVSTDRFRHAFLTHFAPLSIEKVRINHNLLLSGSGMRVRRRLNTGHKIAPGSVNTTAWSGLQHKSPTSPARTRPQTAEGGQEERG